MCFGDLDRVMSPEVMRALSEVGMEGYQIDALLRAAEPFVAHAVAVREEDRASLAVERRKVEVSAECIHYDCTLTCLKMASGA